MLQVALLSLAALGWAWSVHSAVLLDNARKEYIGGYMTHFVLLVVLAVMIFLYFASRRRARA